jgi:hypothetical protein
MFKHSQADEKVAYDVGFWWSRLSDSNRRPAHYEAAVHSLAAL